MKTFNDNAGRTWTIAVNVDTVKRVRGLLGINLLEVIEGELIEKFRRDPVLLVDVIYAVCKPEADKLSVTDEDFGRAMWGDAIEHATAALLDELVSFSPSPRDRRILGQVLEKMRAMMDRARDVVETKLESGLIEKEVERALATASGSSGSAPGSSESTPAP